MNPRQCVQPAYMHYPDGKVFHIPSYQATFDILHAHTTVETSCYRRLSDLAKLSCNKPMHLRARAQITGS